MRRSRGVPRRYTRRIKTIKYSNETSGISTDWDIDTDGQAFALPMVAQVDIQGVRKCKNFELSLSSSEWHPKNGAPPGTEAYPIPILWALVYVPQGTSPNPLTLSTENATTSIYEPNQNVIMSGIWPDNLTSNYKVKTRLARNLNSGDSIYLIMRTVSDQAAAITKDFVCTLNYAIAY